MKPFNDLSEQSRAAIHRREDADAMFSMKR